MIKKGEMPQKVHFIPLTVRDRAAAKPFLFALFAFFAVRS